MTAPPGAAPGQAAYEAWAEVLATNGVECEPFAKLGNVEQMAWHEVEAVTAAAAAQPAPGDERVRYERAALIDTLVKIRQACKRPEDVAGKTSGSGIVNGKYLAEHILRIIGALPHITEQPAPAAAPELTAAMAETRRYRERITALIGELRTTAAATHPSRKSEIEYALIRKLQAVLDGKP